MHMNSAPHLRLEDRQEFERVLDDALRTAHTRPGLDGVGQRLSPAQLRTMALGAAAAIAACAATEYEHFTAVRDQLRRGSGSGGPGLTESGGAGLFAVLSVLAPVLAGTAAVIFLAVGYTLTALSPDVALGEPMRNVGWVFAALAAAGLLAASVSLVRTALRNSASSPRPGTQAAQEPLAQELERARAAWRAALLDRGVLPFFRDALARADAPPAPGVSRTPRLGYSHPGFTSPRATEDTRTRPRYSSPDFTSPDFTGPDETPD
ncbi:hypothetical protein JJV70_06275 [Streptomyces sp. JJ66]|uniref:hypothetical protein n=1 Tax=Streptomyces sp. JJ66 TaxID=2803843 RepID=UPI001C571BFD|nr:hypothetical protein [Streptomyces sp. JJ66]MBW1601724.1 hypothetical protein [Streptomyces sp. JJ66]